MQSTMKGRGMAALGEKMKNDGIKGKKKKLHKKRSTILLTVLK